VFNDDVALNHSNSVMAGLRPGHPRLSCSREAKTWMPGTRAGMTNFLDWLLFETDSAARIAGNGGGWQFQ
jgi:hypothetical protein